MHPLTNKGHGMLAWIIHMEKTLWSGKGMPTSKMYSGLAEVYGVYTALSFLTQYEATFPITYHKRPQVYVCCDNDGVIELLKDYVMLFQQQATIGWDQLFPGHIAQS